MSKSIPQSILIADDDAGVLRLAQKTLEREGYRVATAASGNAAIDWLCKNSADLLLLDLKLGDLHATHVIDQITSFGIRLPFVIVTGQGDERVAVEMMKRGALDYVMKDSNFLDFLPTVVQQALTQIDREKRLMTAERTLREKEDTFRLTLNSMLEGCQTLAFDWRYLYVNPAAAQHARCSIGELLGHSLLEVYPGIENSVLFSRLKEAMETRIPAHFENALEYSNGEVGWFDLSVQPVPEGLFILSLDITKRKRAERFRKLQYDSALILAEGRSATAAVEEILEHVLATFNWQVGEFWKADRQGSCLSLAQLHSRPGISPDWKKFSSPLRLPAGLGVPGRVYAAARPLRVPNLGEDNNCTRAELAQKFGLQVAFAFPIIVRDEVLGVLCFFGASGPCPEEEEFPCFETLGRQIGQFMERKELERELLSAGQEEQSRLGRDLHDGLGQQLTALEFFATCIAAELKGKSPKAAQSVRKLGKHLRDALQQTRAIAHGLSPVSLNERGLVSALDQLATLTRNVAKVQCKFAGPKSLALPEASATHLYRIAQESINNALRHGRASQINISLTGKHGQIELSIDDNGCGFASFGDSSGMGLRAMKYRADLIGGEVRVESRAGKGTRITCSLPTP